MEKIQTITIGFCDDGDSATFYLKNEDGTFSYIAETKDYYLIERFLERALKKQC